MSRLALQRVMVRMLYDPEFATRVLADPVNALPGDALTAEERAWLARPDARAWRADPDRPRRALAVLGREYPAAVALAVAAGEGLGPVGRFFATDLFAQVVTERGSMAAAFGDFLAGLAETGVVADRRVAPLARLEQAVVLLRRRYLRSADRVVGVDRTARRYRLEPRRGLHRTLAGTADLRDKIYDRLAHSGRDLAQAVFEPGMRVPRTRVHTTRTEPLLLEIVPVDGPRTEHPVGVAEITEAMHTLLEYAEEPRTLAELAIEVERLGADSDEGEEIIAGLVEEGILAAVELPSDPPVPTEGVRRSPGP